ncbi:MAG: DUF6483 family protein [bacterium]|nr:DUF6483 family protein [bacterium]
MIKEDYILRMIERLAIAIAKVLKLKETNQHREALVIIDETFQELFGLNSKTISSLPAESIIELLGLNTPEEAQKCFWIADLIKEEADIYELQKDFKTSELKYLDSLELYLNGIACRDYAIISNYLPKIKEVVEKVKKYTLQDKDRERLLGYYKEIENYPELKDLLLSMLN